MNKNTSFKAWLAFSIVAFFWGTTYLAIRVGVSSFPPFLMAALRHCIGGVLICGYFFLKGYKLPSKADLKVLAVNGFLMLVLGNGLVTWAEIYISSGLAALICSITPIWIVLINSFSGHKERITWKVVLGFGICLGGQFLIFRDHLGDFANPNYLFGIIFILIANLAWSAGTIYSKNRQTACSPLFGAGLQMMFGGAILMIFGSLMGEWKVMDPSADAVWALAYLIIFGSILAYGAYVYVLKQLPATIVSTYAYINTVVAVFLGWLWLGEELNLTVGIAVTCTIGGVWLVNSSFYKNPAKTS